MYLAPPASISVGIITRDRVQDLLGSLGHLVSLPERPEIIVVDHGSSDGTVERVHQLFPQVKLLALEKNLGAAGRNVAVRLARHPYVAFSDDDSWWQPGALARAVDCFDRFPRLALLNGKILVGPEQRLDPVCQLMARSNLEPVDDLPGVPILGFVACGAVVRRNAFLRCGGFSHRMGVGGEEQIVALDLMERGWGLAYVDDIIAYHHPSKVRNPEARRQCLVRNGLWSSWLRRSFAGVTRDTARTLASALHDRASRSGLVEALRGLPWVLSERQPVSPRVEEALRRLR